MNRKKATTKPKRRRVRAHAVASAAAPASASGGEARDRPPERIAKMMARAGLCSRREAEVWIKGGRVAVNGTVIASPALNVSPRDNVVVDGRPLPVRERTRLFLYHKTRGLLTTRADPQKRPTVFDKLPADLPRLVAVGRLDLNSEGLLLLTNEGGLARALELPATGWLRRYRVRAHGRVTQAQLDALAAGIEVEGIRYGPIEATLDREQGSNVWLTVAIREGKNREVRNVLGALGLKVNRLIRVSFGPFRLGNIPEGGIEEVKSRTLREQLGERLTAAAGADFSAPLAMRRDAGVSRVTERHGDEDEERVRAPTDVHSRPFPTREKDSRRTAGRKRTEESGRRAARSPKSRHGERGDRPPHRPS